MTRTTKILLGAGIGIFFMGAISLTILGIFLFWELGEGTRLSQLGYESMAQKDYDGAIRHLTEASNRIVLGDNRFWLYVNRGSAEIQKKRYDDAITDFTRAIEIDPSRADAYQWRAEAYGKKNETDKALADYDRAIERDPNAGFPHLQRGEILYNRDEIDKALVDFQEVVRIWPNSSRAFLMRGRCFARQNDLDHALASFDAVVTMQPWNLEAHDERGKIYRRLGESERAFFDMAEAEHLAGPPRSLNGPVPSPTPTTFGLDMGSKAKPLPTPFSTSQALSARPYAEILKQADTQIATGDYDGAIESCNQALAFDLSTARRSSVTLERGSCLWRKGEFEKADEDYDRAITINPRNALAYVYRGVSLDDRGESEDALKDFAEAIRINPREYFAYCCRGLTFFHQGDYETALTDFGRAMEISSTLPEAYLCRASLAIQRKIYSEAIADCSTGIEFHPDSVRSYALRSIAYLRSGKFELAEADLKTAKNLAQREDISLHDSLAWLRSPCPDGRLRNRAEGLAEAQRACAMVHWKRWHTLDTLAAAEAEAGDFRKAIDHEQQALDMAVPPVYRQEVEQRLNLFRQHRPFREEAAN